LVQRNNLTKKTVYTLILTVTIATILITSLLLILPGSPQTTSINSAEQQRKLVPADSILPPVVKNAGSETQFSVSIAYAYVGPPHANQTSYFDKNFNTTMVLATNYPSAVYLNFTRLPSNRLGICDAVIQVYGIKISTDTGVTEYHAYSVGTNYTAVTNEQRMILLRYSDNLIDANQYSSPRGIFDLKWEDNTSLLSHMMGSAGTYTIPDEEFNETILSNAGIPNSISVTVSRLGYVTMSNGSVTINKDAVAVGNPVAQIMLSKYEDGFIYNTLIPTEKLSQIDLFHPK
jgi:hypothetical protein